jgi:hypothetical protein
MGSETTVSVTLTVPDTGFIYLNMHLDYGLKGTGNYNKDGSNNAIVCSGGNAGSVAVAECESYGFSVAGAIEDDDSVSSVNSFKPNPGVAGNANTSEEAGESPVPGSVVTLKRNSNNVIVGTTSTDEDGFYQIKYKHTGSPAPYTVTLTPPGGQPQSVVITLKGNGFAHVNFVIP